MIAGADMILEEAIRFSAFQLVLVERTGDEMKKMRPGIGDARRLHYEAKELQNQQPSGVHSKTKDILVAVNEVIFR